jgi:hypothetical protein
MSLESLDVTGVTRCHWKLRTEVVACGLPMGQLALELLHCLFHYHCQQQCAVMAAVIGMPPDPTAAAGLSPSAVGGAAATAAILGQGLHACGE